MRIVLLRFSSVKLEILLLVFFLSLYILTAPGAIHESDGLSMYEVTKSIVEYHNFSVPEGEVTGTEGLHHRYYSPYGIGQSIFAVPLYVLGKILSSFVNIEPRFLIKFMVSMFSPIVTAFTCLLIYKLGRKFDYSIRTSAILSLSYGLATMAWPYSKMFFSEPLLNLFILSSVYLVIGLGGQGRLRAIWFSGIFLGLAIITKIAALILIPSFLVYVALLSREEGNFLRISKDTVRNLVSFAIPVAVFILLVGFYNYVRFGSAFITGYIPENIGFSTPFLLGLYGLLASPGKSFFLYNPILGVSLFGLVEFYKKKAKEFVLFVLLVLTNLFFFSIYKFWEGGWGWGPRFLVIIIPYFILFLGTFLEKHRAKKWVLIISLVLIASFLVQMPAILVTYQRHYYEMSLIFEEDFTQRINFEPKYSPLINQWKQVGVILRNTQEEGFLQGMALRQAEGRLIVPENTRERVEYLLENNIFYNSFDFWLPYLYYFGFSPKIILLIASGLVLSIVISGHRILSIIRVP